MIEKKKKEIKAIKSECKRFCVFLQIGQLNELLKKRETTKKKKIKKKSVFATSYKHEMSKETMFY